jgi:hypothetical protein
MLRKFDNLALVPEELMNLDSKTWIDIQEYDFRTNNLYGWASMVHDSTASNGRAVRMPGNHYEWATTIPIRAGEPLFKNAGAGAKYKIVVYVRCDATVNDGPAMTCGVYDQAESENVVRMSIEVSKISGLEYQKIEFDPIPLTPSMYIWFAPPRREGEVQAIYIDRTLIIKEK